LNNPPILNFSWTPRFGCGGFDTADVAHITLPAHLVRATRRMVAARTPE